MRAEYNNMNYEELKEEYVKMAGEFGVNNPEIPSKKEEIIEMLDMFKDMRPSEGETSEDSLRKFAISLLEKGIKELKNKNRKEPILYYRE